MSHWTISANGLEGKSTIVVVPGPSPEKTKVIDLKAKVKEKIGLDVQYQRLLYGGKDLQDDKILGDYPPLGNESTIQLVTRLAIGMPIASYVTSTSTVVVPPVRAVDPAVRAVDPPVRAVDPSIRRSKGPCMVTHVKYEEPECVILPCNHVAHPDGLMQFCQSEVFDKKKWEVRCFQPGCNTEWSLGFIAKCGATRRELEILEKGLSVNHCNLNPASDIRQCPRCQTYCERVDRSNKRARCWQCTKKSGTPYDFCWNCCNQWIGDHKCATDIDTLLSAPDKDINGVKCPSIRACLGCNTLIEHKDGCKHMTCSLCKKEFCFVCLRPKANGTWQCGASSEKCNPAPRPMRL